MKFKMKIATNDWLIMISYLLFAWSNLLKVTSGFLQIKETVIPRLIDCQLAQRTLKSFNINTTLNCLEEKTFSQNIPKKYYSINRKTNTYILQLTLKSRFVSPSFFVERRFGNILQEGVHLDGIDSCYYEGVLLNIPGSKVVLDTCGGLNGIISLPHRDIFITPIHTRDSNSNKTINEGEHVLSYDIVDEKHGADEVKEYKCKTRDAIRPRKIFHDYQFEFDNNNNLVLKSEKATRVRRSISRRRYVELMVVADQSMFEFYGRKEIELRRYLLSAMSIVTSIMKDSSIGNSVDISVVKLLILKKNPSDFKISSHASKALKHFCKWQRRQNKPNRDDPEHFDAAILVTRENLCSTPHNKKCDTLGLAELGSVCDHWRSCAIVEDNGLSVAFTIAHEIGHLLNAPHDSDSNGCEAGQINIMTPSFSISSKKWTWSKCSRRAITDFLDLNSASCLLDKPSPRFEHPLPLKLPGEIFTMDEQCKLVYGENSTVCPFTRQCDRLWCMSLVDGRKTCHTNNMPWTDGTKCGRKAWCIRGECTKKRKLTPVHGEWGAWSDYGNCSRPCGGGIKHAVRKCDNPTPKNNGNYCTGKRYRYKSCNTQRCQNLKKSFRASQCETFNGKNLGIPGVPSSVKWTAKVTGIKKEDRCKLFCEIKGYGLFYELANKVIDGTKCQKGSTDICVDGKCLKAGCDNIVGSDAKVDNCGVCNGDNSTCITYYGKKTARKLGYNFVVNVPRGASRLQVIQTSNVVGKHDTNFLALLNQRKKYVFNGQWRVSLGRRKYWSYGTAIYYSGPNAQNETIWIPGTLLTDVEIRVLSITENPSCKIEYSFNFPVSGKQKYMWSLKKTWSECFPVCRGYQVRGYECLREIDLQVVADSKCAGKPPKHKVRRCNNYCQLKWEISDGECTPFGMCGHGVEERKVSCRLISNDETMIKSQLMNKKVCRKAGIGKMPPSEIPCYIQCTSVRWVYTQWSACNATCGGGVKQRSVQCIDQATKQPIDESNCSKTTKGNLIESCSENECPKWHTGAWSGVCSVTCGRGYVERIVYCVVEGQTVPDKHCNASSKPDRTQPCIMSSCARWKTRAWSKCSRPCGTGHQIREVYCETQVGESVSDSECEVDKKPVDRRKCFEKACELKAKIIHKDPRSDKNSNRHIRWLTGLWGECTRSCGRGQKERVVACVANHEIVNDDYCIPSLKPAKYESCNSFPCPYWRHGKWSDCTKPCGNGTQTRLVLCGFNGTIVSDDYCDGIDKPHERRFCNEKSCPQNSQVSKRKRDLVVKNNDWKISTWSKCSATCGFGVQKRKVECIGESCRADSKPTFVRSCNSGACPGWNYGVWTECYSGKQCGIGWQARIVVCQKGDGMILADSACNTKYKPVDNRTCELKPCKQNASWVITPWQPCNVPCGDGLSFRHISCEDANGNTVPDSTCLSFQRKPQQQKKCRRSLCPYWYAEAWEQCDSSCTQKRVVVCKQGEVVIDENRCKLDQKPVETRDCVSENCVKTPTYSWKADSWSQCSKTCGYSLRFRKISCVRDHDDIVSPEYCKHIKNVPLKAEQCFNGPCPPKWVTQPWSECSVTCGRGVVSRLVNCQNADGRKVDDNACSDLQKPSERKICNLGHCNNDYRWVVGPWSECSLSCGVGETKREVFCVNKANKTQQSYRCNGNHKPGNMKVCNVNNCPLRSCRDVQKDLSVNFDGEQILQIGGGKLNVYCEGMQRSNPKEFITLKADPRENYAEIYDKRLRKRDFCPNKGSREIPCKDCIDYLASGMTFFKKVRIDVRKMSLIPEDKTFADQFGRNPPGYASAGDCYSNAKCPQGRFMINLIGTGLCVAPEVTWQSRGYHTSQKIQRYKNNQIVYGTCGGYCGMCAPNHVIGLRVRLSSSIDKR